MYIKPIRWGLLTLILLIVSGCASFVAHNPEEIVRQRVNERWDALIEGRLETAYTFETPEYRELYSFSDYRNTVHGVGSWRKIEIEDIDCVEDKCVASIVIYATIKLGMGFEAVESDARAKENWIHHSTSGQWYHISDH
ncbi:hypothetical protein [Methyloprofundus sp.]|uniref:hypothetical protein n=1 Tax=Methyloprofundus sp. TaxID=2020875 RepID=UPI003D0F3B4B